VVCVEGVHNIIRSAVDFVDELRDCLPVAIESLPLDTGTVR
jgi:hypothetical protein